METDNDHALRGGGAFPHRRAEVHGLLLQDFLMLGVADAAAVFGNAGHESKGLSDDQEDKPVVKGSRGGAN